MDKLRKKPHYAILDGLRGVAAIIVVVFHIFEAHAKTPYEQIINHGYLAVDFFFMLSGFVIAYAYNDRWEKLNFKEFMKRRIVRLQPMIFIGMITGALFVFFQQSEIFPKLAETTPWQIILLMLLGFFVIPVPPSIEIRGWGEMHPLNGPAWSLFFEYIANILYALFLRKFSVRILSILVSISALVLVHMAITRGYVAGGWELTPNGLYIGFTRLAFPFLTGLLLCRISKLIEIRNAFLVCSLLVLLVLSIPRIGGEDSPIWINGLYESLSIIFIFPIIILLGAGGKITGRLQTKTCHFLGEISYPLYITHYPLIYIYWGMVYNNNMSSKESILYGIILLFLSIALSYMYLKVFDEPIRKWLKKKLSI